MGEEIQSSDLDTAMVVFMGQIGLHGVGGVDSADDYDEGCDNDEFRLRRLGG